MIAALLLASVQTVVAAAESAPAENDIVVIGRRVQRVKFTLKTNKSGQAVCRIKRTSGDPEIDGLACDAAAPVRPAEPRRIWSAASRPGSSGYPHRSRREGAWGSKMLRIEDSIPAFAATAGFAAMAASILYGCSAEPKTDHAAKARTACSSVRSEYRQGRELVARRVQKLRSAASAAGKPDIARDREFQRLMADIERVEGRYAIRSKECVGE
jgi:hypothetical protein